MYKRSLLIAALTALALARPQAQAPAFVTTLADSSTVIAAGHITGVTSADDGVAIYTYVTLQVAEILKGSAPDGRLVIKQIGGSTDGLGLHVDGQARFSEGDEVLVFLAVRPRDRTLYTVGLASGAWHVTARGPSVFVTAQTGTTLDIAIVRSLVSKSNPSAEPFLLAPPEMATTQPSSAIASFRFLADGPARWHQADDGLPIPVDYATVPGGLPGGGLAALDTALGEWNAVGTTLRLNRALTSGATCPTSTFSGTGRIAFYWNDPCGEIGDGDAVTFGVGGGYFTPGSLRTINGVEFQEFLQGIAILNNVGPHLTTPACFEDAATHVLGHAVGLGDSSDGTAVMSATLRAACASGSSGLGADDVAGLRAIYPAVANGGVAPHPPTAFSSVVTLNTVTLNWTPATTGGVVLSYLIEAGSAPGQANLAQLVVPGSQATLTVTGVPAGTYFVRVSARNGLGTSAPSLERVVNVGTCQAPGAPSGVSYSVVDQLVSLTWMPPPSGAQVQSYFLSAGYAPGQSNAAVVQLGPTPAYSVVAPPGSYFVRVQAVNSCGVGPASGDVLVSVQPCAAAPSAPTGLAFTRAGNLVTLQWNAPASGAPARYRLVVGSMAGGADLLIVDTADNATSLMATAPSGRYFVKMQAVNPCGASSFSNEISVIVP